MTLIWTPFAILQREQFTNFQRTSIRKTIHDSQKKDKRVKTLEKMLSTKDSNGLPNSDSSVMFDFVP